MPRILYGLLISYMLIVFPTALRQHILRLYTMRRAVKILDYISFLCVRRYAKNHHNIRCPKIKRNIGLVESENCEATHSKTCLGDAAIHTGSTYVGNVGALYKVYNTHTIERQI